MFLGAKFSKIAKSPPNIYCMGYPALSRKKLHVNFLCSEVLPVKAISPRHFAHASDPGVPVSITLSNSFQQKTQSLRNPGPITLDHKADTRQEPQGLRSDPNSGHQDKVSLRYILCNASTLGTVNKTVLFFPREQGGGVCSEKAVLTGTSS